MPLFAFAGASPKVHPSAWIAPTATLVGDVTVEANASVWYGAVIGPRTLVAAGATIAPNTRVDGELMVLGDPARVRRPLSTGVRWWVDMNPEAYRELARRHRETVVAVGDLAESPDQL